MRICVRKKEAFKAVTVGVLSDMVVKIAQCMLTWDDELLELIKHAIVCAGHNFT